MTDMSHIVDEHWADTITLAIFMMKNNPERYELAISRVEPALQERFDRNPHVYGQPYFIEVGTKLQIIAQENIDAGNSDS